MEAALVHEGARHDLIVDKVAGEIPSVGLHITFGHHAAESVATARRIKLRDTMD
tara:strand:+ start:876 stop:1037 length:162 start_codon:yes stop_codon:yes gene_type:complete